jgi:uncharacterized protein YecA (UPF0149 family)
MKRLSYKTINSVMGKEQNPIQNLFGKKKVRLSKPRPRRINIHPNNNDPCPCGSGLKFKKCCKITSHD